MRRILNLLILGTMAAGCASAAETAAPPVVDLKPAIAGFVQSHAAVSEWANQIGRWYQPVCPRVIGLKPAFAAYVAGHVITTAREVGAYTAPLGKACAANVDIIFTPTPQQLLDHIATHYRDYLGFYYQSGRAQVMTFHGPLQAWYVTGTQALDRPTFTHPLLNGDRGEGASGPGPARVSGSRLHKRLRSEILHITIIADANALSHYSVPAIADYIAELSLTRLAPAPGCGALPSISNLLSADCAATKASAMTPADLALLKALYSADLENNLNLEQSDIQGRMTQVIERH